MIVAIPRERLEKERRVALVPDVVTRMIKSGAQLRVQRGAGLRAGFPDEVYERAGATLFDDAKAFVYVRATGARDCLLGLILIASAYLGDVLQLIIICSAGLVLSLADFLIAFFGTGRRMKPELLAHLAGIVGFGIILVLLAKSLGR